MKWRNFIRKLMKQNTYKIEHILQQEQFSPQKWVQKRGAQRKKKRNGFRREEHSEKSKEMGSEERSTTKKEKKWVQKRGAQVQKRGVEHGKLE